MLGTLRTNLDVVAVLGCVMLVVVAVTVGVERGDPDPWASTESSKGLNGHEAPVLKIHRVGVQGQVVCKAAAVDLSHFVITYGLSWSEVCARYLEKFYLVNPRFGVDFSADGRSPEY